MSGTFKGDFYISDCCFSYAIIFLSISTALFQFINFIWIQIIALLFLCIQIRIGNQGAPNLREALTDNDKLEVGDDVAVNMDKDEEIEVGSSRLEAMRESTEWFIGQKITIGELTAEGFEIKIRLCWLLCRVWATGEIVFYFFFHLFFISR